MRGQSVGKIQCTKYLKNIDTVLRSDFSHLFVLIGHSI